MTDLEKAKEIFSSGEYTFVLVKDDDIIKSSEKGLRPIVDLIDSGKDFFEYSICDKICGRASSFLYVLMGLKAVYAPKMAKLAIQILDRAEIEYSTDQFVETILDSDLKEVEKFENAVLRSGSAVKALDDIKAAF